MSKQDPKSTLFERLEPELARDGFKVIKSRGAFERDRGDVSDLYKLDFYTSTAGNRIQPAVIMRFAELDRIYHQISGAKPADRKYHAAISFAIWRVYGGSEKQYEFVLSGPETVESVAASLLTTFREIALPFFESHSTIADVDRLFNEAPNEWSSLVHNTDRWTRCAYATIAAKLVGNPRYDQIVQTYASFLKTADGGHYHDRYRALLEQLERQAASDRT